jgi:hypothetical protein
VQTPDRLVARSRDADVAGVSVGRPTVSGRATGTGGSEPTIPAASTVAWGRQFDTPEAVFDLVREYRQAPTNTASAMTPEQWAQAWMAEWQRANRVEAVVSEADEILSRLHDIVWAAFNEWEGEDGRRGALNVIIWEIHDLLRGQPNG